MRAALFLGNSHLAAIKLAYDAGSQTGRADLAFFCARGADLAFTEVAGGVIRPVAEVRLDVEELRYFFPEAAPEHVELYCREGRPMADLAEQFCITGGADVIPLDNVADVFYVAGTSPYDFARCDERGMPVTRALRRYLLRDMLGEKWALRRLVMAIRQACPRSRHYLIGAPLKAAPATPADACQREVAVGNRLAVRAIAETFLFDAVFMPPEEVLNDDLSSTRLEYARDGLVDAFLYQIGELHNKRDSVSDATHMNLHYGDVVWRRFIWPLLEGGAVCAS